MDIEKFERRFLTRPSSIEAKTAAANLKMILGGKSKIVSPKYPSATTEVVIEESHKNRNTADLDERKDILDVLTERQEQKYLE